MDVASLHSPLVRRTIEAINEGRLEDFMALFARDAAVVDGPTYRGREAIRTWAQRETFGVQMHIDVIRELKVHLLYSVSSILSSQRCGSDPVIF